MAKLDNIFNKFFPQSQTVGKGIFLYRLAWAIEITIACIGILIGLLIMFQSKGSTSLSEVTLTNVQIDDTLFALIFFIVAIVELTKIPLAYAVYYAQRTFWRVLFIFALVAVNVSTFETIITGFERVNQQRTATIKGYLIEKNSLEKNLIEKRVTVDSDNLNKQIKNFQTANSELNNQINEIENQAAIKKQRIYDNSNNIAQISSLKNEMEGINKKIEKLEDANVKATEQLSKQGFFGQSGKLKTIINNNLVKIEKLEDNRETKRLRLIDAEKDATRNNKSLLDSITNQTNRDKIGLENNLSSNNDKIENLNIQLDRDIELNAKNSDEIKEIQAKIQNLIEKINVEGPQNQVFRIATWFRGFFIVDYEKEIRKIDLHIVKLNNSKYNEKILFWDLPKVATKGEIENIDERISLLEDNKIRNQEKLNLQLATAENRSVYSDLPEEALTFAFWIWFGVLGLIVSITGTLLAFASINLQDPRLHQILNKPNAGFGGVMHRTSKLITALRRYLLNRVKYFMKPIPEKIVEVEKIVEKEVEVEKIVEKIVEKPVIQERIVEKEIEVPKQIEKKIFVHVPLPTDDPEVIKKGPIIYNDKDIDKGKK